MPGWPPGGYFCPNYFYIRAILGIQSSGEIRNGQILGRSPSFVKWQQWLLAKRNPTKLSFSHLCCLLPDSARALCFIPLALHSSSCAEGIASDYLLGPEDSPTCPLPHKNVAHKWFRSTCFIHSYCLKSRQPNTDCFTATQLGLPVAFSLTRSEPEVPCLSQTRTSS